MTQEEFNKRFVLLEQELVRIIKDAPLIKSQDLLGLLLGRIFGQGRDSGGSPIGAYKPGRYKAIRNLKGLRIDTVDLQFDGDLFRSINTGIAGEDAVIGFTNLERAKIAGYLEEKYGKVIFPPSDREQEETKTLMVDFIKDELRASVKSIFG